MNQKKSSHFFALMIGRTAYCVVTIKKIVVRTTPLVVIVSPVSTDENGEIYFEIVFGSHSPCGMHVFCFIIFIYNELRLTENCSALRHGRAFGEFGKNPINQNKLNKNSYNAITVRWVTAAHEWHDCTSIIYCIAIKLASSTATVQ